MLNQTLIFKNRLVLVIIFSLIIKVSFAQNDLCHSKCEAIIKFFNSKEVILGFRNLNHQSDSLIVLDPDNALNECQFKRWQGFPITILTSGAIVDSIKRFKWNYVIRQRRNIYVFKISEFKTAPVRFTIYNGMSGVFSSARVKKIKKTFHLGKIENSVE